MKNLSKAHIVSIVSILCLGTAIVAAASIGVTSSPLAAIAFGLWLGITGWVGMYRMQPEKVKSGQYSFVPPPAVIRTGIGLVLVSSVAVYFADLLWLRLAGTVGVAVCIGVLIVELILSETK